MVVVYAVMLEFGLNKTSYGKGVLASAPGPSYRRRRYARLRAVLGLLMAKCRVIRRRIPGDQAVALAAQGTMYTHVIDVYRADAQCRNNHA